MPALKNWDTITWLGHELYLSKLHQSNQSLVPATMCDWLIDHLVAFIDNNNLKPRHRNHWELVSCPGRARFSKAGPEKPFVKLQPTYSVKLIFLFVAKGIEFKITARFRASKHLRFEAFKELCHPKCARKGSGRFKLEKWAPDRTLGTNRFKNLTKGSWQENQNFKENDKTFKFIRHVSTETSVIFSLLMYKALEVEFISREKC